ncbi:MULTISPECIES: SDR family NAD(P)-dependent oxidoreductase [unclassified Sphingopyxis]|uniref:SDR family NAD(P)-dependent oxidoreductase n=1 Tax=unclassified Sphingopyxis TaxID=2614943 RepID=UPI0009EB4898|nr:MULTISPECIES: SDR family oxidoreductase [unclassified Sphingopyxis]
MARKFAIFCDNQTVGVPFSVYSATKAAIRNVARGWILDLKDRKIRVNVLAPGGTRTPGLHGVAGGDAGWDEFEAGLAAGVPLGRLAEPREMGKVAAFLASDAASYVHGVELFVDGGFAQI